MAYQKKEDAKTVSERKEFIPDSRKSRSKRTNGKNRTKNGVSGTGKPRYAPPETDAIGDNDPSWYIPEPMVMDQASRMSFSNFIGVDVELDPNGSIPSLNRAILKPGALMQVFTNPCPGYTTFDDAKNAAVNQQAFRLYARLSSINAKNTLYTPNDVTTIILALGELIKLFAIAQRAYGLLWTYNVRNRLMPANMVNLSGIDVGVLSQNAADYLTTLNTLIVEANRIPFPSNIEYFKHSANMYSGVYQDSESSMAELYMPLPYSTWELEEDLILEGTVLKTKVLFADPAVSDFVPMDPFEFLDIIRNMITKLLTSNSYNLVYSDIMNLATKEGNVSILKFVPVAPEYSVMPTYDREWLLKMNNATIVGVPLLTADQAAPTEHTNSNDVLPDKDIMSMVYAPQWTRSQMPDLALQKIINFYNDAPTLEERVIATRLMMGSGMYQNELGGKVNAPIVGNWYTNQTVGLGDQYIVGVNVFTRYATNEQPQWSAASSISEITEETSPSILTRFSQHPYIYEYL